MKFARWCQSASREGAVWSVKDSRRTSSQRRQGPRQTASPRHRSQKRAPAGLWPASFGSHRLLASAVAGSQRCGQMPAGASSARRSSTHRGGTSRRAKRHAGGVHGFGEGRRVPFGQALGATRAREWGRKNGTVRGGTISSPGSALALYLNFLACLLFGARRPRERLGAPPGPLTLLLPHTTPLGLGVRVRVRG